MRTLVEICLEDVGGAAVAAEAGADGLEVCAGLADGGTTPTLGFVHHCAAAAPGLDIREWYGVIVPAATPAPIVDKLNAEMVKVFKRPDVQKRLTEMGAEYVGSSPQALSKQLANDVRTWAKWVKDVGIRVD